MASAVRLSASKIGLLCGLLEIARPSVSACVFPARAAAPATFPGYLAFPMVVPLELVRPQGRPAVLWLLSTDSGFATCQGVFETVTVV